VSANEPAAPTFSLREGRLRRSELAILESGLWESCIATSNHRIRA
jgi:hypothetical protein